MIYHDRIATAFTAFAVFWVVVGMAAGVWVAALLVWPGLSFDQPWLSYGRLRTFHTNVVLFGFAISALIGTALYSVQRTSHVPLYAPRLAWFVFYGWQITMVLGFWSILAGWNGGKEYAELEWPFDIAIAVLWVSFAIVFFGTIAKRRMWPIYVSK
jgi:cytochrome c oxidase cbb3-type subunit I